MVFSSYTFLFLFLPIVLLLYYIVPNRNGRNFVLFIFSIVFYSWGEPVYIVLMLFSIINDYTLAMLVDKYKKKNALKMSKLFLILSIVVNLGLLGFFKYYGFVVENINMLFNLNITAHNLALPIGISFYTFQTMSYSIDVYRGKTKVQKNILTLATYVALFPQLIAGPIVRYVDIESELENRKESFDLFSEGSRRFVVGLSKKVLLANPMGYLADYIYNGNVSDQSTLLLWLGAIAFSLQIYFDFSGYSDMAIGLGKMFGFNFLENFNYPYIAKSITDFWRRWHISLSSWFRDYLYIPLGGNRGSKWKLLRNLFIVWFATGLWHGASWNYVLWGLYYFILLVLEKFVLDKVLPKIPVVIAHITTKFLIIIGWVLFRIEDFTQLKIVMLRMFTYHPINQATILLEYQNILYTLPFLIIAMIVSVPVHRLINLKKGHKVLKISYDVALLALLVCSIIFLAGESYNPFIYYRF